jgi:hypothetical protein
MFPSERQWPRSLRSSGSSSLRQQRQRTVSTRRSRYIDCLPPRTDFTSQRSSRTYEATSLGNHGRDLSPRFTQSPSSRGRRAPSMSLHPAPPHIRLSRLPDRSSVGGMYPESARSFDEPTPMSMQYLSSEFDVAVRHIPQRQCDVRDLPESLREDVDLRRILGSIRAAITELSNHTARTSDQSLLDQVYRATVERMARRGRQRARLVDHPRNEWEADPVPPYAEHNDPPPAYDSLYAPPRR